SAGEDGTVKVWDARSTLDVLTLRGHTSAVCRVAFSADGKQILSQDAQGKVLAWDAASGQLLPDPPAGRPASAGERATSPNGRLHVYGEDTVIRVRAQPEYEQARQRDRETLEQLARFDPDRDRRQLTDALLDGDDFAAGFYRDRLVRRQPWDAELHVHL